METGPRIRLLLIDTSTAGIKGSMSRYAGLVEQALKKQPELSAKFESRTLCLSLPRQMLRCLPGTIATWVNHAWIMLSSKFRITQAPHDIIHLLDGSYGYILKGIDDHRLTATVHDLIPLLQQQDQRAGERPSPPARWIVNRSVEGLLRCRCLVAVSNSTCNDLKRLMGVEPGKITVLRNALDPGLVEMADQLARDVPRVPAESPAVVLHVGHNGHYKNREGVLRIFSLIKSASWARLVMAGPPPTVKMRRLIKALALQDSVEFVHHPQDTVLHELYRRASVFLFPSLYEGFGWPPLEAMAFGCPVVCSSAASLPEVAGDVALMDAPDNEAGLAQKCLAVLNDPALARAMGERGKIWSRQFTLERMGAQLVEVYRQVLEPGEIRGM